MDSTVKIQCPWCFEFVDIWIDPGTEGELVRDCEICCRPWDLDIHRDRQGRLQVQVRRSN